jgi:hypothetical protein
MRLTPAQTTFLAAATRCGGLFWNGHENGWVGNTTRALTDAEADVLNAGVTSRTAHALAAKGLLKAQPFHGTLLWVAA